MGIHEECGVFGVMNKKKEPVAELVYYGLYALQHRGQAVSYTHLDVYKRQLHASSSG